MSIVRNLLLGTKRRRAMTLLGMAAIMALGTFEIACQVVAYREFAAQDKYKSDPAYYYEPVDDPILYCRLKPNYTYDIDGRHLHINRLGFREDSDETFPDRRRVAILGDSVVFGVAVSQDQTIPAVVQSEFERDANKAKILNCGRPGLGLTELPAYLNLAITTYHPQTVIYVMNPNDFVLRDSRYEGGDGGLYRSFVRPWLKSPLVLRKAIYRMKKGGVSPSIGWYRWTFDGTKSANLPRFKELQAECKTAGAKFHVVLLPIRGSFSKTDKTIAEIYKEIGEYLTAAGIEWSYPSQFFADAGATGADAGDKLIDNTDHLTIDGCKVMGAALKPIVEKTAP